MRESRLRRVECSSQYLKVVRTGFLTWRSITGAPISADDHADNGPAITISGARALRRELISWRKMTTSRAASPDNVPADSLQQSSRVLSDSADNTAGSFIPAAQQFLRLSLDESRNRRHFFRLTFFIRCHTGGITFAAG